jgi:adenosylcobinamide-GDP ribazoletransferase
MLGDFFRAVRLLTVLPAPPGGEGIGPAALFFPVAGLLLGAIAAGADAALHGAPVGVRACVAAGILAILSGFGPLRGLAEVGDGAVAGGGRGGALEAMKRPRRGVTGVLIAALAIAAEVAAIWHAGPLRSWALLFAPMLGRWAMVVVAFSARRARAGTPGPRFDAGLTFREFGWASAITGGAVLATIDAIGLLAMLPVAAVAVVLRLVAHRWLGGINESVFAAAGAVGEVTALLVLAAIGGR